MTKNKRTLIVLGIIIFILLIIAFICILKKEPTDRTINLYNNLYDSKSFTFSIEEQSFNIDYKVVMTKIKNNVGIDMIINDEHTTTLVLNNRSYVIDHKNKEYYCYESNEIETDIVISELAEITRNPFISGNEEINGTEYYYEEYENKEENFVMFADTSENSDVKTRFYFENKNITYIKNIVITDGDIEEELLKIELEYESDENIFGIPEDYIEIDF